MKPMGYSETLRVRIKDRLGIYGAHPLIAKDYCSLSLVGLGVQNTERATTVSTLSFFLS